MCSIPGLPSTGSNVPVLISRVNLNPSCVLVEFWGNFDQDRKFAYQQMKKEIQYPREAFHESDGNPGDLCLVRIYETWYRARIVSRDSEEYSVFLIDEGRTLRATTSTLAWGKTDFFYLPPEVEFCILANVLPLSPENRWSAMALEFMKTFCGRRVNASVQDVLVPHRTFLLDIPCLSRQMYEMGFAKRLPMERFKEFVAKSLQTNSETAEPQRISSVWNKPIETMEQIEKPLSYMYPELQTDTVETVVVTEVTNPFRIFCQLKVFSQELRKLTEQITRHCEGRIGANFARPENLGSPCASRGSDGKWYRSVLQQVMSANNVVEVLHVDYGKKHFVQVENVRPLALEFFRMPVVTYVCSLHGIVDRGVGWTASQIDYLKSLLLNRTVIAKFQYQSLSEGVHYVTLYGEENTNINKLFEMKQKSVLNSDATLADFALQKSPESQKSRISERIETKQTDNTYSDLKGNKPVFFTETLPPNTSHVAVVQHIDSPAKFWVQTQRYADEFNQLMNDLGSLYSDPTSTEGLIRKPVAGLLCVAKSQDGVYYRAAVYKVMDKKAEVYFLDYGNAELVDCFNLRQLPLRFQQLPAVAVKCSLFGIKSRLKQWDQRATLFFTQIVEDKVLDLHVHAKYQDTHIVRLVVPGLDGENDVSRMLCDAEFADTENSFPANPAIKSCSLKTVQTSDTFVTSTRPEAPSSSSAVIESASAFKEYLFPIGSSLEVTVSYIESPNDFWCQKARNAACLELLMQDMQRFYAHSEFQPPLEAACVACHPETGIWYRALVIHKHQTPHVDVLFVDYGQTKKVAIADLRKINPTFLKLKGQAFRCSLYNLIHPISHSALDWSPEATLQFQEFVDTAASMNVPLKCTIFAVMYDSQKVVFNVVDLETPFQSICNFLVQKRLADRAPSKKAPLPPFRLDTYYYSTHDIKTGCEEEVCITCVKSTTMFFCHLARNSDQIEKLADKVNSLCKQLEITKCPQTFGTVCFAKYSDGGWYRGQIKSTKPSIVVHFVDYGDTLEVNKSDLLPVPIEAGEIMSVPVQAVECGLSDIPEDVPCEVGNWFQNFADSRTFRALIVAKEPGGKLIVELYDGKTQVNALIRQKFHKEIHRHEQSQFKGYSSKNSNAGSRATHLRESSGGLKRSPVDEIQQCRDSHIAQRGNSFDSKQAEGNWRLHRDSTPEPRKYSEKYQNAPKQNGSRRKSNERDEGLLPCQTEKPDGVKSKSQISHKESELPVKLIKPGLEAEVYISQCNSPFSFFLQLARDEDDIYSLVEKLNNDQSRCASIDTSDIYEGDLVNAMFPDDNSWYRAAIRKITEDTIDVEFVDFGNTASISASKICHLDQYFLSFPRYSIHCSLNKENVDNKDQEVTPNFKEVIESNSDKVMCTFVKMSGSVWEVKLELSGVRLGFTCREEIPPATDLKTPGVNQNLSEKKACTYYKNSDISVGQTVTGYASFIKGPQVFWCQCAMVDKLQEISDILQNVGNALENTLNVDSLPVGSACIALFCEDNLWYRAKVTSKELDALSVTFVDYGNESKISITEVRALPSGVLDVPPQAFACQLEGFNVSEGSWDEKADDEFFELINDKLLNITVKRIENSETPLFVKLECNGVVINDAMRSYWRCLGCESPSFRLGGEPIPPDSVATEIGVSSVVNLEEDTDHVANEKCTTGLKMQLAEEDQHDIQKQTENEAHADPVLIYEDITSPETSIVYSEAQEDLETTWGKEHEPIPDSKKQLDFRPSVLPQHSEEAASSALENIDSLLLISTDSQLCIEEPELSSCEIIQSDLGYLRRATEKKLVGSECVIWSHVRRKWCRARILKVSEDAALVLLIDCDSEVVVDPLSIFEILPDEPLQALCVGDAVQTDEGSNKVSDLDEGDGPTDKMHPQTMELSASDDFVKDTEVERASGAGAGIQDLVKILPTALVSQVPNRESRDNMDPSFENQRERGAEMSTEVDLLMDFLDVAPLEKAQDTQRRTEPDTDTLFKEFDDVTEDLIILTSDGAESDTASDGTLQGEEVVTEIHSNTAGSTSVLEESNAFDCTSLEEQDLRVTHLTLKVEDSSDDVIFVGVLQESQAEVHGPGSEMGKQKCD